MDTPFDVTGWEPTKVPELGEEDIIEELPAIVSTLVAQTQHIYHYPYDPNAWFERGKTLARLRYPELVVGDSYKAVLLCQKLLDRLGEDGRWRLGSHMGFWMLDDREVGEVDANVFGAVSCGAVAQINRAYRSEAETCGAEASGAPTDINELDGHEVDAYPCELTSNPSVADSECYPESITPAAGESATSCTAVVDTVDATWEQEVQSERMDDLEQRLLDLLYEAQQLEFTHLDDRPGHGKGGYSQRLYPWIQSRHCQRSDKLIAELRNEFASSERKIQGAFPHERIVQIGIHSDGVLAPYCTVNRHAFGNFKTTDVDSSEHLGIFATQDIMKDTVIVVDETAAWGCTGPGTGGSMFDLQGGGGCSDPIHPNLPSDDVSHDLRWIRDRAGKDAAKIILSCRLLMCCIHDGQHGPDGRSGSDAHPLDHSLIARLTPKYRRDKVRSFSLEHDIVIPNDLLLLHGVDIFAAPQYDTWVLFTLYARIENNGWSDPTHMCISPLFSLFNHSCEPNVNWTILSDHTSMIIRTVRDVTVGEQLFVEYDGYQQDQPLAARRKRMRKWLDAECQCTKCLRQEAEERRTQCVRQEAEERCTCGCGGCRVATKRVLPSWDLDKLPVFPEDAEARQRVWSRRL